METFTADDALSRGASISLYTITPMGSVLVIVVAIAGLAFGGARRDWHSALRIDGQGKRRPCADRSAERVRQIEWYSRILVGAITLNVTASGVFGEMQWALNAIWKVEPRGATLSRLMRARAASLWLVAALGFLLMVSLVVSTVLSRAWC